MKNFFDKLPKIWVYIFLLFFVLIPILSVDISLWLTIFLFVIIVFICKKFDLKHFPIILFATSLILRLAFNLFVETEPISDFKVLFDASQQLLKGDTSFNQTLYFSLWPYQLGFVVYQTLLLKIWNSLFFLKLINCICSSLICLLIYLISKKFVKEKSAQIISLVYSLSIFSISYTSVLSNQHMASLLVYFALYIILTERIIKDNYIKYIVAAILIAISNIIRPEAIITIFAIILYLILLMRKTNAKKTIIQISLLLIIYFSSLFLVDQVFINTGLSPNGLKNNAPHWKFVLGFNHETNGTYSDNDIYVLENEEAGVELIKERIFVSPLKLLTLFKNKILIFWNRTSLSWSFTDSFISTHNRLIELLPILENHNSYIYYFMYILIIVGIYNCFKNKKYDNKILLILNQVFVTFGVFLLIEVQPRYSYYVQISVIILASLGLDYLLKFLNKNK